MQRKKYTAEFKSQIVLEVLKEEESLGVIAQRHNINPNQIRAWRKEFISNMATVFSDGKQERNTERLKKEMLENEADLLKKVGQLTIENEWLKKKSEQVFGPDYEKKFSRK